MGNSSDTVVTYCRACSKEIVNHGHGLKNGESEGYIIELNYLCKKCRKTIELMESLKNG